MTQFPTDWHSSWSTYEWWGDIGTGLLSFLAAVVIGGITVTIAIRSHQLARRSAREVKERADRDDAERYRDQLIRVVEPAVTELVAFGNLVDTARRIDTAEERQARAAALSRLVLVDAVAQGKDRELASAISQAFFVGSLVVPWGWVVRVQVAGRLAGALAAVVGKQHTHADLLKDVESTVAEEEAKARAKAKTWKDEHPANGGPAEKPR